MATPSKVASGKAPAPAPINTRVKVPRNSARALFVLLSIVVSAFSGWGKGRSGESISIMIIDTSRQVAAASAAEDLGGDEPAELAAAGFDLVSELDGRDRSFAEANVHFAGTNQTGSKAIDVGSVAN